MSRKSKKSIKSSGSTCNHAPIMKKVEKYTLKVKVITKNFILKIVKFYSIQTSLDGELFLGKL